MYTTSGPRQSENFFRHCALIPGTLFIKADVAQDLQAFRLLMPVWNLHNGRPILLHSRISSLENSRNFSMPAATARKFADTMRSITRGLRQVDDLEQFILLGMFEDRDMNEDPEMMFQCHHRDCGFAISYPKLIARN
ncbi:hypothetical protein OUZ56_017314 [Daphnia magna]|uniref:Uncharacterized protein n=1 Tax=Daphnia magna TaxID=35525 RepID=A0ABR0ASR2_9CRUS|nr:hypothetical protein OUZ56_017314 [Daphnia magna]